MENTAAFRATRKDILCLVAAPMRGRHDSMAVQGSWSRVLSAGPRSNGPLVLMVLGRGAYDYHWPPRHPGYLTWIGGWRCPRIRKRNCPLMEAVQELRNY